MDIFAFPSATDTYGNVVLEAMASGVPPVVTNGGGPKYLVTHGVTGLVSSNQQSFLENVALLAGNPNLVERMRIRAREFALCRYWHRIFEQVYDAYQYCLHLHAPAGSPVPAAERTVA